MMSKMQANPMLAQAMMREAGISAAAYADPYAGMMGMCFPFVYCNRPPYVLGVKANSISNYSLWGLF